jgi:uncharacterized protein HemY
MARARDLLEQGHSKKAFAELARLHANPAHAPEVIHLQASIAMQLRDWPCALSLLEAFVRVLPNRAIIHLERAACLIALNRLADARAILEGEDKRLRNRYPRYLMLARIAALQGDVPQATAHLNTALEIDQKRARAAAVQCPELARLLRKQFLHP